jgi:hypothetical protein
VVSPPAYLHPARQTAVSVQPDSSGDEGPDEYADVAPAEEPRPLKSDSLW